MQNSFSTHIVSLRTLNNYNFVIPTYQRPYVWGEEQITTLLDDIQVSYSASKERIYYISTFLTKEEGNVAELIDGQQRFTTLWLIALVIAEMTKNQSEISNFLKKEEELRLSFEIREEIKNYLKAILNKESTSEFLNEHFIKKQPYLTNIVDALRIIKGYLEQDKIDDLISFGNYIYTNVQLVKNTTPNNTDLNKLFTTINSAGVQLEQTDIIKARLLNIIKNEKVKYSRIWEACENMNNYFERNVRQAFPNWKSYDFRKPFDFDDGLFQKNENDSIDNLEKDFSIDDLSENNIYKIENNTTAPNKTEIIDEDEVYCRSIINFSQLLLHTYRIHLYKEKLSDFSKEFHTKNCIAIFNEMIVRNDAEEIKRFFKLLWKVRFVFDIYIIKWVTNTQNKTEQLELMNINTNKEGYYSRTKYEQLSGNLMLQSVLYFTGDYLRQYWLTPYLYYLLTDFETVNPTSTIHLNYLERMDNIISTRGTKSEKELSFEYLTSEEIIGNQLDVDYFNRHLGTGFKHYWFQKLEYLLWKKWEDRDDSKFKNYRITSKNSVEHIYPQNAENRIQHPEINDEYLHSFGNLVLLSVAQNSEYSNKSVNVKKSMFQEKKTTYDTLKSYYIFNETKWEIDEIEHHKKEMIKLFENHYEK